MRFIWLILVSISLLCAACGDDDPCPDDEVCADGGSPHDGSIAADGGGADGGGGSVDGGGGGDVDGGDGDGDGGLDGGGEVDGGMAGCGDQRPDISGISGTEGLVIARDGTIYYSQSGGVGRLTPSGAPDPTFVTISGAGTVWGLALDAANTTLYVGSPSTGRVHTIDLSAATPSASTLVDSAGAPNGLTIGPDGALYYSDFDDDRVMRVEPTGGVPTEVTASAIAQANGVTFDASGALLVVSYSSGRLYRLTLTDGVETARDLLAMELGNPDGVALDADGRIYVTDNSGRRLLRLEADGTGATAIDMGISAAASVEFGAGPLVCSDIYVASSGVLGRYEDGTAAGAAVSWH